MFHQTEIDQDNMLLNVLNVTYNLIAFVLGFTITQISEHKSTQLFIDLQTLTQSDNFSFFIKSIIAGIISLAVKVSGDMIINYFKERKKNGKH